MSAYSITLPDGRAVPCAPDQSILDACLQAGIPMPYNCRSGECAECRAGLRTGTVQESPGADPAVFSDSDRAQGDILTCLCSPTSDVALDLTLRAEGSAFKIERVNALVESVERVSASVYQVTVETPWEIAYRAGQYFEWVLPGIAPHRSFSAANPSGTCQLVFDIRIYPGGRVSGFVASELTAGSVIELVGPYGHFGFSDNPHRPAVCIVGGTGLAPVKAMIETEFTAGSGRDITLFYGARRAEDLYDIDQLQDWADQHETFRYHVALSDEPAESGWPGARGLIPDLLSQTLYDGFGVEAYLCGPPPMIDASIIVLEGVGLDSVDIHADRFVPAPPGGAQ